MAPYLVCFILIVFCGIFIYISRTHIHTTNRLITLRDKNAKGNDKLFMFFTVIILTAVQGLRGKTVGGDTEAYIFIFREAVRQGLGNFTNTVGNVNRDLEKGYVILNLIWGIVSKNEQYIIFISSLTIVFLHMYFLYKNSNDLYLSVMLYFALGYFVTSFVPWRMFIATGIVMWSIPLLLHKKYKEVLLLTLLAPLFHFSVIIYSFSIIISWLLMRWKIHPRVMLLFLTLVLGALNISYIRDAIFSISQRLSYYRYATVAGVGKIRTLLIIAYFILLYLIGKKRHKGEFRGNKYRLYEYLICWSIFISLLNLFFPYVFRMSLYYDYILLLALPDFMPKLHKNRVFAYISVTTLSFAFLVYYLMTNAGAIVPYVLGDFAL